MLSREFKLAASLVLLAFVTAPGGQAQTYKVLYRFQGSPDGSEPNAPLTGGVVRGRLSLYGTTLEGGNSCGSTGETCGTVFSFTPGVGETVIHRFQGRRDGDGPYGGLAADSEGNGYGLVTSGGPGTCHCGLVYKLENPTGAFSVLYSFAGEPNDGETPLGTLLWDPVRDTFYGVTEFGDSGSGGTLFAVSPSGTEKVLYNFCSLANCADGGNPNGGLAEDAQGNLYGTTEGGGNPTCEVTNLPCGVVFKVDTAGNETVLHAFTNGVDGGYPLAGLGGDGQGNLYGATSEGGNPKCTIAGNGGCGVVFKIDAAGNFFVIHTFSGPDGGAPENGSLAWNSKTSLLYGGAAGGASGLGIIFQMDTIGNETVLYNLAADSDGQGPHLGVILDSAGNIYGTAQVGGYNSNGVIFRLTP